nr:hypothetical protein [Afifella sp. IM 167]
MLVLLTAAFLAQGFYRPRRFYEFPFQAGAMLFTFLLPQLPGILGDPSVPEADFTRALGFAIVCLLLLQIGWTRGQKPLGIFRQAFDERRLLQAAGILSLVGASFYYRLSHLPGELVVGVQVTGLPVVYLFFARLMTYGLVIAFLCFARRPSWPAAIVIAFDLFFYLERIVITGKRAEATELTMIVLLSLWFHRGWVVPRWVVTLGLVAGLIATSSMGDYRQVTRANDGPVASEIMAIDIFDNFNTLLRDGGEEMRNAIKRLSDKSRDLELDFGSLHWNALVFNFVPAQLVGQDVKNSLMINLPPPARGYEPLTGTTEMGFSDAFQSFWYFGALEFFLIAWLLARIFASAREGWASAQIFYILSIVPATHAISHVTNWVLQVWVHMTVFLVPVLLYAAVKRPEALPSEPVPAAAPS